MAKKFAVFDIDGTLIRWQLFHSIVNELIKQGHISQAVGQKIQASRMQWKARKHSESFKEYERTLVQAYYDALTKLSTEAYHGAINNVFAEYKDQVYTYTRDLIRDLKEQDYLLFAISGSNQEVIDRLAKYYGFDDAVGTIYELQNGQFTGKSNETVHRKAEILAELIKKHNVTTSGSIAVGDSEGDIALLELVEKPIAFNPSQKLFKVAIKQGWRIIVERKNMVYELEPRNGSYVLAQTKR